MFLRLAFTQHHLSSDSTETVRLGAGLVATIAAVVRGLFVGSAKNSFDAMNPGITEMGVRTILIARVLAHYGLQANEVRNVAVGLQC